MPLPNVSGNIFRIKQVTNEQTINVNRWSIRFVGLKDKLLTKAPNSPLPGVRKRYDIVKGLLGNDPASVLEISLASSNFPTIGVDTAFIPRFNDGIKTVTKFVEMEDLKVDFYDYVNGSASAIMMLWQAFVADKETGAIGFKQDFVLDKAEFYVYGPDAPGYDVQSSAEIPYLQKYQLVNLFPKKVTMPEHTDSAEPRKVSVEFALDNCFPLEIYTYDYNITDPINRYKKASL